MGVFLCCALALHAVPGATIQTDLSSTIDDGGSVVGAAPLAQSFTPTTGYSQITVIVDLSNGPYNIDDARPTKMRGAKGRVRSAGGKQGVPVTPYTVATLYADNAGQPGAVLGVSSNQISDSLLTTAPQQFTFTFSTGVAANTRYWIGLSSPNGSSAFWSGSDFASGTDITTEFYQYSGSVFAISNGGAFLMGVFGSSAAVSSTPAPSSVWLTLLGLGCAAFYLRRRNVAA